MVDYKLEWFGDLMGEKTISKEEDYLEDIRTLLDAFRVYRNSRSIGTVGGVDITVKDVVVAALISRYNLFFVGRPGWGKSQLIEDVMDNIFGTRAVFFRGRYDLDIREVFERINLGKLRYAKTDEEVRELTENVHEVCFVVDEINRAPPLIQDTFYGLMDGYVSVRGKKYRLGRSNYSIGLAAANLGDGEYTGTFRIDDALMERLHITMDLSSFYKPLPEDMFEVFLESDNPRVKDAFEYREFVIDDETLPSGQEGSASGDEQGQDLSEIVFRLHRIFHQTEMDLYYVIFKEYLTYGLDWCPLKDVGYSKLNLGRNFASVLRDKKLTHDLATLTGTANPFSPRTARVVSGLGRAIEMIARAKGANSDMLSLDASILALKIITPYAGVLDQRMVDKSYYGNPTLAGEAFAAEVARDFSSKIDVIGITLHRAVEGRLTESDLKEFEGKWMFMKRILRRLNTRAKASDTTKGKGKVKTDLQRLNS